ncbi:MAG: SPOR domain-containing protein [Cellvibrionaceae bacterium]
MTRDYAKKRSRSQAKPSGYKTQVPGWVWLFTGSVLGAFAMFLVYLADIPPQTSTIASKLDEVSRSIETTGAENAPGDQPENALPKPRFDFYQLLKESEVVVKPEPISDAETAKATSVEYVLQVGSFKNADDADRLRAQLILLNLDAKIETVKVRNAETWHRVLVGPFASRATMARARGTLADNQLDSLLLQRSAEG